MIDRFNFYDVYGYFIPGGVLILLLWIPTALQCDRYPSADLGGAVIAAIVAYVTGHVLQVVANKVIPSKLMVAGKARYPSDFMLDDTTAFPQPVKQLLRQAIYCKFHLDIGDRGTRGAAVLLCRNALAASKRPSYAEQFQGLYVLMRGLCAAAAIGMAYDIGVLYKLFLPEESELWFAGGLLLLAALIATIFRWELPSKRPMQLAFAVLTLVAIAFAGLLGAPGSTHGVNALSLVAILSLLVAMWTYGAYRRFSELWASTVYQDFLFAEEPPASPPDSGKSDSGDSQTFIVID